MKKSSFYDHDDTSECYLKVEKTRYINGTFQ